MSIVLAVNMLWGVGTKKLGYPIHSLEDMRRGIPTRKVSSSMFLFEYC
jgi:hypothetical protein